MGIPPTPLAPERVCDVCGGRPAPLGLRFPGRRSRLPPERRGYLWTCHEDACIAAAEARRAAAMARLGFTPPEVDGLLEAREAGAAGSLL